MEDPKSNKSKLRQLQTNRLERYHRWGQFFEVLTVLFFAGSLCLSVLRFRFPWVILAVGLFLGFLVSLCFAIVFAGRAARKASRLAHRVRYAITERRIKTLEIVNAPEDATAALREIRNDTKVLRHKGLLAQEELLDRLVEVLGSERTSEIKEVVLKYTKVDETVSPGKYSKPPEATSEGKAKTEVMASTV